MRDPVLNEPRIPFYQKRNNVHIPREAESKKYLDASFVLSMGSAFLIEASNPLVYYNATVRNSRFVERTFPYQTVAGTGDPVGRLLDLGPSSFDLTASADDRRPLGSPNSINFDGVDDALDFTFSVDYTEFTFTAAFVSYGPGLIINANVLGAPTGCRVTLNSNDKIQLTYPNDSPGSWNFECADLTAGELVIFSFRQKNGVFLCYKNGELVSRQTTSGDSPMQDRNTLLQIGAGAASEFYGLVMYERLLPFDDQRAIEEQFSKDFGIPLKPWTPLYYNPYVFIDRNSSIKYQERTSPTTLAENDTDPVGYMTDVSQYGNDVSAPSDNARPTITNGVAIYDGVDDTLQAPGLSMTNEGSVVWKVAQKGSDANGPLWDISNASGTRFYSFYFNTQVRARVEDGGINATVVGPDDPDSTTLVYSAILTSSDITLHTMPNDVTSNSAFGFTFDIDNSTLSFLYNGATNFTQGEVECFVVFDQAMTIPELRRVAEWIIDTYGIG